MQTEVCLWYYVGSLITEWFTCWGNQVMEKRSREKVIKKNAKCLKISCKDAAQAISKLLSLSSFSWTSLVILKRKQPSPDEYNHRSNQPPQHYSCNLPNHGIQLSWEYMLKIRMEMLENAFLENRSNKFSISKSQIYMSAFSIWRCICYTCC